MALLACHSEISQQLGWIAVKFCTDINEPLRMNCDVLGVPLTFHLDPLSTQTGSIVFVYAQIIARLTAFPSSSN